VGGDVISEEQSCDTGMIEALSQELNGWKLDTDINTQHRMYRKHSISVT